MERVNQYFKDKIESFDDIIHAYVKMMDLISYFLYIWIQFFFDVLRYNIQERFFY